ncbi:ROK family transcriptional regulator [Streptomyces sp. NPDC047017]|uniref:ROK family transcriptional regulator n=1 Tax=Streptomyces sp. NPDC047017 TaxID=3155024 RepID=UPI00340F1D5A
MPRGGAAGANLLALRSHNTALVLDLLRGAGAAGISRLELAERTGLTPQAVSKITARLRERGFAAEAGRRASTGGKPRTVLRLVPEAGHAVGVQVERDEVRTVLVDLDGTVTAERRHPLDLGGLSGDPGDPSDPGDPGDLSDPGDPSGPAARAGGVRTGGARTGGARAGGARTGGVRTGGAGAVVAAVGAQVEELVREAFGGSPREAAADSLVGVGVALPGPLDHRRGVLRRVTGFPEWDGFPLRDALERRLGVPVAVDKDTNAAAFGLAVAEEGGGGSFAYLHLGTGLGAGLVIGGSVHRGARTGAGEFGHQVIQLDGPPCACGDRGCLEALCLAAVGRGDVAEAARVLGAGAANLVGLLDIDLVLLGGRTVMRRPEAFTAGVAAVLAARARRAGVPGGAVPVRVVPGGAREVAVGAAHLLLGPLFGRGDG